MLKTINLLSDKNTGIDLVKTESEGKLVVNGGIVSTTSSGVIINISDKVYNLIDKNFNDLSFSAGYISLDGSFTEHTQYFYSDKIYNNGVDVEYNNLSGICKYAYAVAAYDKDDNIIKSKSVLDIEGTGGNKFTVSGIYTFDGDVSYIRLSRHAADNTSVSYKDKVYVNDQIIDTINTISSINNGIKVLSDNNLSSLELLVGYLGTNGTIGDDSQHGNRFRYTDKIYNIPGTTVIIKNATIIKNNICAVAAYDKDDKFLRSYSIYYDESLENNKIYYNYSLNYEFTDNEVSYIRVGFSATPETYESDVVYKTYKYISEVYRSDLELIDSDIESLSQKSDELKAHQLVIHLNDYSKVNLEDGFINTYGVLTTHGNIVTTENIYNYGKPVRIIDAYGANNSSMWIAAYNNNDKFVSSKSVKAYIEGTSGAIGVYSGELTYEFTDEISYIRVCYYKNASRNKLWYYADEYLSDVYNDDLMEIKDKEQSDYNYLVDSISSGSLNRWRGKSWYAYGTSITGGEYGLYPEYLSEMSGLVCTNKGHPGGTISTDSEESFTHSGHAEILNDIINDANAGRLTNVDLVTIEGVINDWNYGRPLGEVDEEIPSDPSIDVPTTVCGGLRAAIKAVLTNSNATVVILTSNSGVDYPSTKKNGKNLVQRVYSDKIIEVAKLMGVHYIDVGSKCQINEYHPEYIANSVHHTPLGGKQYAATIWEELKYIHCNNDIVIE